MAATVAFPGVTWAFEVDLKMPKCPVRIKLRSGDVFRFLFRAAPRGPEHFQVDLNGPSACKKQWMKRPGGDFSGPT